MSVLQNHALAVTELQRALDENERLRAELTKTLDNIAPAIESLACHQQQLDMEGVIVGVSRQAVHEVVEGVNAMACMLSPKKQRS